MLTRLAIFQGQVREGQAAAMRTYVEEVLAPLWRQFDGAEDVRGRHGSGPRMAQARGFASYA